MVVTADGVSARQGSDHCQPYAVCFFHAPLENEKGADAECRHTEPEQRFVERHSGSIVYLPVRARQVYSRLKNTHFRIPGQTEPVRPGCFLLTKPRQNVPYALRLTDLLGQNADTTVVVGTTNWDLR